MLQGDNVFDTRITHVQHDYAPIFEKGLGTVQQGICAPLHRKDQIKPKSFRGRPVPFSLRLAVLKR